MLGRLMQETAWLFPTVEIFHFIGLSLLMGSLLVVDFRLLGFCRDIAVDAVYSFLPFTIAGFCINLVTGVMFLFNDPFRYYPNLAFRIKMLLVLLAGLNALYFLFLTHVSSSTAQAAESSMKIRVIAALSLCIWIGVIVFGRLIPYLE